MHTQLKGIIDYITKRADEIGHDVKWWLETRLLP